jgi:hypothetical protein
MFLGVHLLKMCNFVNLFLKFNIYVFPSRLKNLDTQKMIYHHFHLKFLKIKINCLLVFGGIVVKIDNFKILKVFIFLFHTLKIMGNEIYKQHGFFLHVRVC